MTTGKDTRRGRPSLTPGEAKRSQFNTRLRASLKLALDDAARSSGRSLSEEIEARLEQSLTLESIFGGREVFDLALLLAATFALAGQRAAETDNHPDWRAAQWRNDPWCYETAIFAVADVLWQQHPAPGMYWGSCRVWLSRLFARLAARCGKAKAPRKELTIKAAPSDLSLEGAL
jgi:Arc-like DNA binding domain